MSKNLLLLLYLFSLNVFADVNSAETALRMVKGKISNQYTIFAVNTSRGTTVHLAFDQDGKFTKADGENPEKDELFVGSLGLTLADALAKVKKTGIKPSMWEFTKENETWSYLFVERLTNGQEKIKKVDASSGAITHL